MQTNRKVQSMQITVDLPEELLQHFDQGHLSRESLEVLAVQAYQTEKLPMLKELPADLLIVDERLGRRIANERKIPIIGTIEILDDSASQGLIDLSDAIARLQQTNFCISRRIIQALLKNRG